MSPARIALGLFGVALLGCAPRQPALRWEAVSIPTDATFGGVCFTDSLNGWIAGGGYLIDGGIVGRTRDGGRTWRFQSGVLPGGGTSFALTSIQFQDTLRGCAVGSAGTVLVTADGGESWREVRRGRTSGDGLGDLDFVDASHGWAVGSASLVRTEDGGQSWTPWMDRVDNPKGMHLYAIRPAGGTVYIVGEQGLVLKLDREKQRFTRVALPYRGTLFGVVGTPGMVLVHGLRGNAYRSTDGGANWTKVETGVSAGIASGAEMSDGSVVLVSQAGHVLLSTDEGATFKRVKVATATPAFSVAEAGKGTVAVAGIGGVRMVHPRSAYGAPPEGGDTGGPAEPDPRCPLEGASCVGGKK